MKKKIKPSKPIAELIDDSLLQEWVWKGIERHKGLRKTCGFCGNLVNESLWNKLDSHFSKESEELRKELKSEIDKLKQAKNNLDCISNLTKEQFYFDYAPQFDALKKKME